MGVKGLKHEAGEAGEAGESIVRLQKTKNDVGRR